MLKTNIHLERPVTQTLTSHGNDQMPAQTHQRDLAETIVEMPAALRDAGVQLAKTPADKFEADLAEFLATANKDKSVKIELTDADSLKIRVKSPENGSRSFDVNLNPIKKHYYKKELGFGALVNDLVRPILESSPKVLEQYYKVMNH